jgi:hypothetical protein
VEARALLDLAVHIPDEFLVTRRAPSEIHRAANASTARRIRQPRPLGRTQARRRGPTPGEPPPCADLALTAEVWGDIPALTPALRCDPTEPRAGHVSCGLR